MSWWEPWAWWAVLVGAVLAVGAMASAVLLAARECE